MSGCFARPAYSLAFVGSALVTRLTMSRNQKALTLKEKLDILSKVDENPRKKCVDLAPKLGLPVSTLKTIIGKREEIQKNFQVFGIGVKHTRWSHGSKKYGQQRER